MTWKRNRMIIHFAKRLIFGQGCFWWFCWFQEVVNNFWRFDEFLEMLGRLWRLRRSSGSFPHCVSHVARTFWHCKCDSMISGGLSVKIETTIAFLDILYISGDTGHFVAPVKSFWIISALFHMSRGHSSIASVTQWFLEASVWKLMQNIEFLEILPISGDFIYFWRFSGTKYVY